MKNIYHDNERTGKGDNISSGDFEFEEIKLPVRPVPEIKYQPEKAEEKKAAEPTTENQAAPQGYYMPPQQQAAQFPAGAFQMPYYNPYFPQGIPVQPVQPVPMTPEQMALLFPQYPSPFPYQQPQTSEAEAQQNADSGRRVLYQSADFDMPAREKEENYEDGYSFDEQTPSFRTVKNEEVIIEEETVSFGSAPAKSSNASMQIEEMEMSTFELNSIASRQNQRKNAQARQIAPEFRKSAPQPKPQPTVKATGKNKTVSNSDSFGSFSVEETVNEDIADKNTAKKKKPTSEIIRLTVLGIALAAMAISIGMLLNEYRMSRQNVNLEEGISDLIVSVSDTTGLYTEETTEEETDTTKKKKKKKESTTKKALSEEEQWAQLKKEYPRVVFPKDLQLKYARLYATNRDFVGYLEAKGVKLSLPVVQGKNDDVYLRKNFYGVSTKYGCPFVTHLNSIKDLDQNTIIFGHHMKNGTVFGALDKYKKISGFKSAPVITFNTRYQDYSWKVIAAFITNAYEKDDNGYVFKYYFTNLSTQDRFAAYLSELSQRSLYDTGVDVLPTDKILTLSTCSYEFEDARFVVVARMVRPGESKKVDISRASVNPNPRYPQAYYKKMKTKNPYKNAYRWEVG